MQKYFARIFSTHRPYRLFSQMESTATYITMPDMPYKIFIKQIQANPESNPTIMYCHGYGGSHKSTKSQLTESYCLANGLGFLVFDLLGHGNSEGSLNDCTISDWKNQVSYLALTFLPKPSSQKNCILVGNSIGAYAMTLNLLNPDFRSLFYGALLLCPAIDTPHRLFYPMMPDEVKQELAEKGEVTFELGGMPYHVKNNYIEDARDNNDIGSIKEIPLELPVTILHGRKDMVIPWKVGSALSKILGVGAKIYRSEDCQPGGEVGFVERWLASVE
jgi:abhydrolase domain-containing protein 10